VEAGFGFFVFNLGLCQRVFVFLQITDYEQAVEWVSFDLLNKSAAPRPMNPRKQRGKRSAHACR
jgi:hypothetical protein